MQLKWPGNHLPSRLCSLTLTSWVRCFLKIIIIIIIEKLCLHNETANMPNPLNPSGDSGGHSSKQVWFPGTAEGGQLVQCLVATAQHDWAQPESETPSSTGPPFLSPGKSVTFPRKLQKALLPLLSNTRVFLSQTCWRQWPLPCPDSAARRLSLHTDFSLALSPSSNFTFFPSRTSPDTAIKIKWPDTDTDRCLPRVTLRDLLGPSCIHTCNARHPWGADSLVHSLTNTAWAVRGFKHFLGFNL